MARLMRAVNAVYLLFSAIGLAAMPIRYAFSSVAVAVADRFTLLSEFLDTHRHNARQVLQDIRAVRPRRVTGFKVRAATLCVFAAAAIGFMTMSLYGTGLEVIMDGESAGYVSSQDLVTSSISNVAARVSDVLGVPYVMQPDISYRISVVRRNRIFDQAGFEESLFSSIDAVKQLYAVTVNGETVGAVTSQGDAQSVLDKILDDYPRSDYYDTAEFVGDVNIKLDYVDASREMTSEQLYKTLTREVRPAVYASYSAQEGLDAFCLKNGVKIELLKTLNPNADINALTDGQSLLIQGALPYLSVAHGKHVMFEDEVPFETIYQENTSMYKGEERVAVEGVDGTATVMANQMFMDGQVIGMNVLSQDIITPPVSQVIEVGTKVRYSLGTFVMPSRGRLTSAYGYRSRGFHSGIDLAGSKNSKIQASDGGKVTFVGWYGNYGKLVIIEHNSTYSTYYGHCNGYLVKVGDMVAQGDDIALMGSTGRSTGNHLHFEIRKNNKAINPQTLLKK
jgi:murein DD-endopeptidase MepM/ murein hydrolase activator NlpD